ncbi:MAG TPA: GreA/GreB family elongation factor [Thermoanaerobaculia bacterium]|nr:GreA/GreB family elongation factor [Thermoanaerobaculia bacterium]
MSRLSFEEYRRPGAEASLEDDWLAEVERDPTATGWFAEILAALRQAGEVERARGLYELWDDELHRRRLWSARLEAFRIAGAQLWKTNRLQREVVATLEEAWSAKPNVAATLVWAGLRKTVDDPAKLWDRVTRFDSVLRFDVGEIVAMAGQGAGRVVEINLALETLRIDFERKSGVTLGFRAAAKMLRPLAPENPLRRKLEDPEGLARMRDEQPAELLRAVLEGSDRPLSGGEIRDALVGIVDERQWPSWWAAARRHPQVVTGGSGRQSYRWESSVSGAADAARQSFARAEPRRKIELFRKHADRDPGLARELGGDLASIAGEAEQADPGLAWEIFFALERAGELPPALAGIVDRLLGGEVDPRPLLNGIQDRLLRERALVMLRERRSDWVSLYREQLAREEDPRVLSLLGDGLAEGAPEAWARLVDDLFAQPRRMPAAFVWLVERAADDAALRARTPLRLLQQILAALASEEFVPYRSRLRPLVDSGGTVPRLLAHLEEEQALAAMEAIERTFGLEEYRREPLLAALRLRFSGLASEAAAGPLYATLEAIETKREELKRLAEIEIPANRKAIEEARSHGDLRENFEYKSARQRHEYLNSRVAALHRDLGRARPIDFARLDTSEVRIGARVRLIGDSGAERVFELLGPWDSRPEAGVISYESELGEKLSGRRPGEELQVGENRYRVVSIERAR